MLGWEMRKPINKKFHNCEVELHYVTEEIPVLLGQDGSAFDVESMAIRYFNDKGTQRSDYYTIPTVLLGDKYTLFDVVVVGLDTKNKAVRLMYNYYMYMKP